MRIISLCPSLTELVFDLGAGEEVVGRTRYCIEPKGVVESVPVLGGTKNPKVEEVVRLAPDLVLLNEEENRREDAEALIEAGLTCRSYLPQTVEDTAAMVCDIGAAVGRTEAGERIAGEIEARAEAAREAAKRGPEVSWAYLIWRKPWMAAGGDTFVDALLTLPGGRNVFGTHEERYPAVTAEELRTADPQRIWLSSEPFPFENKHIDEIASATGLPPSRFRLVDGQDLSWHGSRTRRGIDYAVELLEEARKELAPASPS